MNASAKKTGSKTILIVDDHPITRDGLVALLDREPDLEVIAEAGTARAAMAELERHVPDLVLLDLNLPDKDGIELLKDILARHVGTPVLILSMHDEETYAIRAFQAGARGYVMKREGGVRVLEYARRVLAGRRAFSEVVTDSIINSKLSRQPAQLGPEASLTDRELEVLSLFGAGWSKDEIAQRMNISSKTIDVHRYNSRGKLGLTSNSEYLRRAISWLGAHPEARPA